MKIKSFSYILSLLAAGSLVWAANTDSGNKLKLKRPLTPPVVQSQSVKVQPMKQTGATDDPVAAPDGLRLINIDDKAVTLGWNNPEPMNGYFDDFESHDDFVINSPGTVGWCYLDVDQALTYAPQACVFPNMGQKMAFIVLNPSHTSPAWNNPAVAPFSGDKLLASFTVDGGNNDWMISPELHFDQEFQISFRAKTYHENYGLERIRVGYSTTGRQPSDFVFVSQGQYEEIPLEWTLKSYTIPAEARYVAINCVSYEAFILLIDDIFIGTNVIRPRAVADNPLIGYHVYRDGSRVDDELVTEMTYTDLVPEYKEYEYTVKAVYENTGESETSEILKVKVTDTNLLPFRESFDNWNFTDNDWEIAEGDDSKWKIDYYEFGLVNPCATYVYSRLTDYSQSLVSKELHTENPDNVMLRFSLMVNRFKDLTEDFLTVEVSNDKINWNPVETFSNKKEESLIKTVKQCNLSDKLESGVFYIRFRAHGTDAFNINYWYVDDIKVWNPVWAEGTLEVHIAETPVPECEFSLTNSDGITVDTITDMSGKIRFDKLEEDVYKVKIVRPGYNVYESEWEVKAGSENSHIAILRSPSVSLDRDSVHIELNAEEIKEEIVILKNTGDGALRWKLDQQFVPQSGNAADRWAFQQAFNASGDLQSSVGFDGEFYYTGSWLFQGVFNKYDKKGNFIEEFSIPGIYTGIRDFAFDGHYFYAANSKNTLYQIDMRGKELVGEILVKELPDLEIRHCAYDPRTDRFWIGGYNTVCSIDRSGKLKQSLRLIGSEYAPVGVEGSAFDNVTPGGPYLWLSCSDKDESSKNMIDQVLLRQLNLRTMQLTDVTYFLGNIPGFKPGNLTTGPIFASGLTASFDIEPGMLSLVGSLSQSPSYIYVIKACDLDTWLTYSPRQGTLQTGAEQPVRLTIDALKGKSGETYTTSLKLIPDPKVPVIDVSVGYTVTGKAVYARPQELKAENEGESVVLLSWKAGDGLSDPDGYHIYRNGEPITSEPVSSTEYRDVNLLRGTYTYRVRAIYGDTSSVASDSVSVFVKIGVPCYPPVDLTSEVLLNKNVTLTWKSPDETGHTPAVLRWDEGTNTTALGLSEGGFFFAGSIWEYDDLINYRGMEITEAEVFVNDFTDNLILQIRKDNSLIYTQAVPKDDIRYGDFTSVVLNEPVVIEPGYSYNVAFMFVHQAGKLPVGLDAGPAVAGKGNMVSEDGKEWYPATLLGATDGNFNIAFRVEPSGSKTPVSACLPVRCEQKREYGRIPDMKLIVKKSEQPAYSLFSKSQVQLLGYNIYRDGEKINSSVVTGKSYTDVCEVPGLHIYRVSSVYDAGESVLSDETSVNIIPIGGYYSPWSVEANVELNRTIHLSWSYPTGEKPSVGTPSGKTVTADSGIPAYICSWQANSGGESGIASDGRYLYTSCWNADGRFNKYTLDGRFIESFVIEGVNGIRDLACDGTYFYGGDTGNTLYKMDFDAKSLVASYSVSEVVRHCAYIPDLDNGKGGFEVGDWETSIYVSREGAKLGDGPVYKGAFGTAYHEGLIYAFEQGNDNQYTIGVYDYKTLARVQTIDLASYEGLETGNGYSAGGISSFQTYDGITVLGASLQHSPVNTLLLFELATLPGVEGYNLYCNGEKVNQTPMANRHFTDIKTEAGNYDYQVETVYIDGNVSEKSSPASVTITQTGVCDAPADIKVVPSTYGYNVLLSFVDPDTRFSDLYESAENGIAGEYFSENGWKNTNSNNNSAWRVTADYSYEGEKAVLSDPAPSEINWLITPELNYDRDFVFSFTARNADDHFGTGTIRILTSSGTDELVNFVPYATVETNEEWNRYDFTFDKEIKYVALQHTGTGAAPQIVDAISLNEETAGTVYGYYIIRDGKQLNDQPVTSVGYTDRNLLPGIYEYQVKAHYQDGCVSDPSHKVTIDLEYDRPCAAPEHLTAEKSEEGIQLKWGTPAIGEAIYLGWHSGNNYSSAGLPSGGAYYAGVKWLPEELKNVYSLCISEIEVYISTSPDALFLLIYEGNRVVYQQYIPEVVQNSFNTIRLDRPYPVNTDKELKVVLYVEHNAISSPIGFDEGPAVLNKGDLYSRDGVTWTTLGADSENTIDGNWNITVGFQPYVINSPSERLTVKGKREFVPGIPITGENIVFYPARKPSRSTVNKFNGYNVYRNSIRLNDTPELDLSYLDTSVMTDIYNDYVVTALYDQCGEVESNTVTVIHSTGVTENMADGVRIRSEARKIRISGLMKGNGVEVTGIDGRMLRKQVAETSTLEIDMQEYSEGVYFVRVTDGEIIIKMKKVINR